MGSLGETTTLREQTKRHYDRFPFALDADAVLDHKLQHRVMGEALRAVTDPNALILDVGCGSGRVARMVGEIGRGRVVSVDLSLDSLRGVQRRQPHPLVNGDNMQLPFRSGCADVVISNGVIHHTPVARTSFLELARVTKPGGTLVVSVYPRWSWYYYVYRYPGAVIRGLRRLIGDRGLRATVFPLFHLATLALLTLVTRRRCRLSTATTWNLFHDQFTTPQCTFHTAAELQAWARAASLSCEETRSEAARQLLTCRLRKPRPA
jgi:SAM-dependent methyltransferase